MGELIKELWTFVRARQKGWLLPIMIVLLIIGVLAVAAQTSTLGPFLYTLF